MEKRKNFAVICLLAAFLCGFLLLGLLQPDALVSRTERRPLAQQPALRAETLLNGTYMEQFERYTLDQFPLRENFRRIKAETLTRLLRQKDNNGIYLAQGYAAKLDPTLDTASVDHAAARFARLYELYLSDAQSIYACVIPDKTAYLSGENGYPTLDHAALAERLYSQMPYAAPVDLTAALCLESYYRIDLHWRQEALLPAAKTLAAAMGLTLTQQYETAQSDAPFYGVYCGQSALPLEPDTLRYLTNDILSACTVYDYETQTELPVYTLEALTGQDPYSVFLGGSKSILRLTNPNAATTRELLVFRDSFASSLIPLLAEGYAAITLVDIRYVQPERLGAMLELSAQDVLFLYSEAVLNDSSSLK